MVNLKCAALGIFGALLSGHVGPEFANSGRKRAGLQRAGGRGLLFQRRRIRVKYLFKNLLDKPASEVPAARACALSAASSFSEILMVRVIGKVPCVLLPA